MSHSLNEIEAMAKKAARGAGYTWGMAEEAAKACRWLESHQLPGAQLLADVLTRNDQVPHNSIAPVALCGVWTAPSGTLCPIVSGAALNDSADKLASGESVEMANLSAPLLIVPFAAWAAIHLRTQVAVSWADVWIETDGFALSVDGPEGQTRMTANVALARIQVTTAQRALTNPGLRGDVSAPVWERLSALAHRTYAPATPESRELGAGAGVTDND